MGKYAAGTKVPADRSRVEVEQTLKRYGATHFGYATMPGVVMLAFESKGRRVRFKVPVPDPEKNPQGHRQKWRAVLLAIKSKLESVDSGIEQFDEAFMAQLVLPDGRTMAEFAMPQIAQSYTSGKMPPLLGHDP
jgi:hypothetical protein